MKFTIEIIPHSAQRYPTVGDWFYDSEGTLQIKVSKMSDARFCILVGIHELIEATLCIQQGITQEEVDEFDMAFEKKRSERMLMATTDPNSAALIEQILSEEPGDSNEAPYYLQHQIATGVERILAAELQVDWNAYDKEIKNL